MAHSTKRIGTVLVLAALGAAGASAFVHFILANPGPTAPRSSRSACTACAHGDERTRDEKRRPAARSPWTAGPISFSFLRTTWATESRAAMAAASCAGAHAAHRSPGRGRCAPAQFQRRKPVYPQPLGPHDRALRHPLRDDARAGDRWQTLRPDALGNDHRQAAVAARLRHRALRQMALWAIAKDVFRRTRDSTNGTEFPIRPTCRCTRLRPDSTQNSRL